MKCKQILSLALALLLTLPLLSGCNSKDNDDGTEILYVRTQAAYYDRDGICTKRLDYTYDETAQVLSCKWYEIEGYEVYDPTNDIWTYTYDATCPLVESASNGSEYSYDDHGNCETVIDGKYLSNYFYHWTYEDSLPVAYQIEYLDSNSLANTYHLKYDDSNITALYYESNGQRTDNMLLDYDSQNRLKSVFFVHRAEGGYETIYRYKDDRLDEVELRNAYAHYPLDSKEWDDILETRAVWEFEYDKNGNLTALTMLDGNGTAVWKLEYSYDRKGYPTKKEYTTYGDGEQTETLETYTCDDSGNIIEIEHSDGTRTEYTYQSMTVTHQQADYYRRRLGYHDYKNYYSQSVLGGGILWVQQISYLIPNPLFDFPYLDLLA